MKPVPVVTAASLSLLLLVAGCDPTADAGPVEVAALSFDGVDDHLEVADAPALDISGNLTITAWYFHEAFVTGEPGLIQKDGPGSWGRYGLWITGNTVDFCVFIDGGAQSCVLSTIELVPGTWTHVAGVYDGSTLTIYLDGVAAGSASLTGAVSVSDQPLYLGGDPSDALHLPGRLHEVQLWNVARSAPEILAGMDEVPTGSAPGLIGHWRMNEGTGQVTADATGNGLHGRLGVLAGDDEADPAWVITSWPHP